MVRVLLVDDHATLREPLAFMFDREPDFEVVAHAGSLAEARTMLEGVDLAVLDLDLPDGLGTELIEDLHTASPEAMVLVLTGLSERTQFALAIEAGAAAVLRKSSRINEIVDAARRLCEGEILLSPREVVEAMQIIGRRRRTEAEAQAKLGKLTPREKDILQALGKGLGDKEIARFLHISPGTVHSHMARILAKLEVESRLQALIFVLRHGVVEIDSADPTPPGSSSGL